MNKKPVKEDEIVLDRQERNRRMNVSRRAKKKTSRSIYIVSKIFQEKCQEVLKPIFHMSTKMNYSSLSSLIKIFGSKILNPNLVSSITPQFATPPPTTFRSLDSQPIQSRPRRGLTSYHVSHTFYTRSLKMRRATKIQSLLSRADFGTSPPLGFYVLEIVSSSFK
jgi:hypothetical protein